MHRSALCDWNKHNSVNGLSDVETEAKLCSLRLSHNPPSKRQSDWVAWIHSNRYLKRFCHTQMTPNSTRKTQSLLPARWSVSPCTCESFVWQTSIASPRQRAHLNNRGTYHGDSLLRRLKFEDACNKWRRRGMRCRRRGSTWPSCIDRF